MLFQLIVRIFLISFPPHEYHVSITHIEVKDQQIQISQKLFADDMEKALLLSGKVVHFKDDLNDIQLTEALQIYVRDHFRISISGKEITLKYVGVEWDNDYHAFYLFWEGELKNENTISLEIFNNMLLEVSAEQQNKHYLKSGEKESDLLLDKDEIEGNLLVK